MNQMEQIDKAQKNILDHLAKFEDTLAELYDAFAQHLPAYKVFWKRMAEDERSHGRMLHGLESILSRGFLFYNIGQFKIPDIEESINRLETIRKAIQTEGIDIQRASNIASQAESSVLDGQFFKVVSSDAPEFQIIAKHLQEATEKHSLQVQKLIAGLRVSTRQ